MKSAYEKVKIWRAANPDKVNEQARRYRARHPETNQNAKNKYRQANIETIRERDREARRIERKRNPEAEKERQRRFSAKKEALLYQLAGRPRAAKCELCGEGGKTVFDHCHASGNFRGWLCDRCNRTLGQVKDSIAILEKMIGYLEKHNGKTNHGATKAAA